MTFMTVFDDVNHKRGKTMNGKMMDRQTCEATRSVSMPERPTAAATTRAGTRPRQRVSSLRITGYGGAARGENGWRQHR